jgi:hypothetical protein
MSDYAKFVDYLGAVVDHSGALRVMLPIVGGTKEKAHQTSVIAALYDARGERYPAQLRGASATKLPRGGQSSERRFFIAVDSLIEHRLGRSRKLKQSDGATAAEWSRLLREQVSDDTVKSARLEHGADAGELMVVWVRWAREVDGITRRSDNEILAAYQRAIRENAGFYPADSKPRGRKKTRR